MLMGEPSPSLTKINEMNTEKLRAKIASLLQEQDRLTVKLQRLNTQEPLPTEKIKALTDLQGRLATLQKLAQERLEQKLIRKADYEERTGNRGG